MFRRQKLTNTTAGSDVGSQWGLAAAKSARSARMERRDWLTRVRAIVVMYL